MVLAKCLLALTPALCPYLVAHTPLAPGPYPLDLNPTGPWPKAPVPLTPAPYRLPPLPYHLLLLTDTLPSTLAPHYLCLLALTHVLTAQFHIHESCPKSHMTKPWFQAPATALPNDSYTYLAPVPFDPDFYPTGSCTYIIFTETPLYQ